MTPILQLAIEEAPGVIAAFKALFAQNNPAEPELTDEQVITAFNNAFASSLAKDDLWRATHPEA